MLLAIVARVQSASLGLLHLPHGDMVTLSPSTCLYYAHTTYAQYECTHQGNHLVGLGLFLTLFNAS
jgi:hypothetical protein